METNDIAAIYGLGFSIGSKLSIRSGFQGSFRHRRLDFSKLTYPDLLMEPTYGITSEWYSTNELDTLPLILTNNFLDFSTGISIVGRYFTLGVSAHHLTQPNKALLPGATLRLPLKVTGHFEARIPFLRGFFSDTLSCISPAVLFQRQQDFQQFNLGASILMHSLIIGAFYRNRDALIAVLGFERKFFAIRYSYDITISPLTNATAGAH